MDRDIQPTQYHIISGLTHLNRAYDLTEENSKLHLMDVSLKQKAYIENLEAELNECKMLNNQLMSDLDADEGLAEICVNEFIADTIKAVKDAGVKKITVEF